MENDTLHADDTITKQTYFLSAEKIAFIISNYLQLNPIYYIKML